MKRLVSLAVLVSTVLLLSGTASAAQGSVSDADVQKITAAMPDKPQVPPAKPRKLLVYNRASGFYHDSIPIMAKALELMGEKTGAFTTVVTDDPAMITPEKLKDFDAVFMNSTTGNCFAPKGSKDAAAIEVEKTAQQALLDFVKGGKGLAGNHAATDCYYGWKEYGDLIGAYFAGHPYSKITVKIDDPASPINAAFGGQPFQITDEMYVFKDPYSREKLHILLSIDNEKSGIDPAKGKRSDGDYAISWIKDYGQGRVFYCSFGHRTPIFTNGPIMRHFLDGIQFALGDLKADTTPSAKVQGKSAAAPAALRIVSIQAEAEFPGKSAAGPAALRIFAAPSEPGEKGFKTLFNGKDLEGWQNAGGKEPGAGWVVKDGTMTCEAKAGDIWTKDRFGDFVLDLEFMTKGNSGIFIRTDNPKDCVQTGIEVQIDKSWGKENPARHDCGAIYDCLAPSKCTVKENEWNRTLITCKGPKITVVMNGEQIIDMDLDKWTEARKNPDGSGNKFNKALKDFKREGHIGLQDHGAWVAFRNIRIKPLDAPKAE